MTVEAPAVGQTQKPQPECPKEKEAVLGDQVVILSRLGTRDGLAVAQTLLRYISELREPLMAAYRQYESGKDAAEGEDADRTGEYVEIGMEMVKAVMGVLGDDDLLKVLSRLLGQPVNVVGDAPLEDVLGAVADALSINDMPALMRAASRIWEEMQRMGNRL